MTNLPTAPAERRSDEPDAGEAFSPEYLAMLVICGGTVRDSDWDVLPDAVAARRPRSENTEGAANADADADAEPGPQPRS